MAVHTITKGLNLPISGDPPQKITGESKHTRVAILADDYPGMKPRMFVEEGTTVKRGQLLFEDRKTEGVRHTAPGAGRVIGINRGERRALQSVVIDLSESERAGSPTDDDFQPLETYKKKDVQKRTGEEIRAILAEAGLWTAIRKRPFGKVPPVDSSPRAIFVTAMDTNPLAPDPALYITEELEAFDEGLEALRKLTEGTVYLCVAPGAKFTKDLKAKISVEQFVGPHPSGTAGVHIHLLEPVSRSRVVWHIGYQDVIAIGKLLAAGRLDVTRVVSVAGPVISKPRVVRTRMGGMLDELFSEDELAAQANGAQRVVSGSVLSGKKSEGLIYGFLGRYHNQVSVLKEGRERFLFGWLGAGSNKFSVIPAFISKLMPGKKFDFDTNLQGSPRAMVPIGMYEKIMPMDILPTFLLRSLIVGDVEQAEKLGALELDEEDVALCTFVCPGKTDYGPILRRNLQIIEEEG